MKKVTKKKSSILDRAENVSEVEPYLTMLCYGKSSTGKTVFGATFPKPSLLIEPPAEDGTESIVDVKGVKRLRIEEWEELEEIYWELAGGTDYKSVIIDQLTALQRLGMEHLKELSGQKAGDVFSQRNWGRLSGLMQTWIENYRNLKDDGYHVLFNAHEKTREPNAEEDERIAPWVGSALMDSVATFVNGAVSVIGNTFIREEVVKKNGKKVSKIQYCMRIGPHAYYAAKIRRPVSAGPVPGVIVNPTFDKILAISKGAGGEEPRKVVKVKKRIK